MQFSREVRHILFAVLACLTLVGLSATYWAVAGDDSLLRREDNPRLIEAQARIQRGGLYDRHSQLLAETVISDAGLARRYLNPSTYSLTGYYSLRYGVGGAEAAFDEVLSGSRADETLADYFNSKVLHLPQVGGDIMLTIDAGIHDALVQAIGGDTGAAVVLDAQTGALLALVSLPSYDPNRLDEDWSALIEAEGDPFFNRALQGNYPLGGNIYALWLAQAIEADFELSWRFTGAADPVELDDGAVIHCVIPPESDELTLTEALLFGCPAPFKSYQQTPSANAYDDLISSYLFAEPFALAGFPQPEEISPAAADAELEAEALALRNTLGQGQLTTSPLHLAAIMAAMANDGVARQPKIHAAQRQPGTDDWRMQAPNAESRRILDSATAQEFQALVRDSWDLLFVGLPRPPVELGAYIAMSRSGDETQLWLNGYLTHQDGHAVAFVILLEDTNDLPRLVTIGQALIDALAG